MSDVKRYLAKMSWTQIETQEHPNGEFVLHSDYARLKAEVERLRKAANNYIDVCDKYAMFRCDEERLMARAVALELMTAAKEGKPNV